MAKYLVSCLLTVDFSLDSEDEDFNEWLAENELSVPAEGYVQDYVTEMLENDISYFGDPEIELIKVGPDRPPTE